MTDELSYKKCPCGDTYCKDFHLVGIGKFVQGSGFTEADAAKILHSLKMAEEDAFRYVLDLVERGVASTKRDVNLVNAEHHGFVKTYPGPFGTFAFKLTPKFYLFMEDGF